MLAKFLRRASLFAALAVFATFSAPHSAFAAPEGETAVAAEAHGAAEGPSAVFDAEHGSWLNGITRWIGTHFFGLDPNAHGPHGPVVKYDYLTMTVILWVLLMVVLVSAARKAKIRPEGKPASSANLFEAAVDGFQDYLIGVMGEPLARKYTPLIASFFFTILVSNWVGLIPGLVAPTSNPTIPIALALVAFISVHIIAIKEAGVKSWFMHFVGEPIWLCWLNFPLHIVGELVKPLSLSLRLLCNVFGEEQVVVTLTTLAITILPIWLPIPFQLPMLFLGTFFGLLQALVFSTLLAIYIAILATHHDDHDAHNDHGHVEHDEIKGHHQVVGHPSQMTVG